MPGSKGKQYYFQMILYHNLLRNSCKSKMYKIISHQDVILPDNAPKNSCFIRGGLCNFQPSCTGG